MDITMHIDPDAVLYVCVAFVAAVIAACAMLRR